MSNSPWWIDLQIIGRKPIVLFFYNKFKKAPSIISQRPHIDPLVHKHLRLDSQLRFTKPIRQKGAEHPD